MNDVMIDDNPWPAAIDIICDITKSDYGRGSIGMADAKKIIVCMAEAIGIDAEDLARAIAMKAKE